MLHAIKLSTKNAIPTIMRIWDELSVLAAAVTSGRLVLSVSYGKAVVDCKLPDAQKAKLTLGSVLASSNRIRIVIDFDMLYILLASMSWLPPPLIIGYGSLNLIVLV